MISIACLAITQPKQSSYAVWHNLINDTGWDSNGFVFLLGLINPTYGFGGLDGAVHLAEDCFEPAKTVPRALCYSLVIGFVTAFFFAVAMLYCVKDIEAAIDSRTGYAISHDLRCPPHVDKTLAYRSMKYGSRLPGLVKSLQSLWLQ